MYNFKIIEQVLCLSKLIIDISDKFKVMHFISNNLLHDFSNDKYMFSYKEKFYVKLRANPTHNPINPTQTQPNRPICHVYLIHSGKYVPFGLLNSLVNIKYYESHNKHNNFINNCLLVSGECLCLLCYCWTTGQWSHIWCKLADFSKNQPPF